MGRLGPYAGWRPSHDDVGVLRLEGALRSSDSAAHVMTEALHAMIEARFLVVTGHQGDAVAVLDKGIGELRYALNISDVEPE